MSELLNSSKAGRLNFNFNIWAFCVLVLAGILRFYKLGQRCLFGDEVSTLGIISGDSWLQVWLKVAEGYRADLPFYYIILHYWNLINQSLFWLNCFSVFVSLASLIAAYRICVYLFDKKAALLSIYLLAISPLHILYAQMIRYYSLISLLNIISLYFFIKFIHKNSVFKGVLYVLFRAASIYINYASLLFFLFEGVFLLTYKKKYPLSFRRWLVFVPIILILCFPAVFYFFRDFSILLSGEGFARLPLKIGFIGNFIYTFFAFSLGETVSPFNYPVVLAAGSTYLFIIAGFLKAYFSKKIPREPANFLLMSLLVSVSACSFSNYNSPRYILAGAIIYGIIVSLGILQASKKTAVVLLLLLTGLKFYALNNLYASRQYANREIVDSWDDIALFARSYSQGQDVVLYNSISFAHYYKFLDSKALALPLPKQAEEMRFLIKEKLAPLKARRIIFADSPLSGNMMGSGKEKSGLLKEWLKENNFELIREEGFDRDEEAVFKRRYIARPFPEYRTIVYVYAKKEK